MRFVKSILIGAAVAAVSLVGLTASTASASTADTTTTASAADSPRFFCLPAMTCDNDENDIFGDD
ncbi:hypothetical protein ACOBQX_05355 [Actinokineospora sp. G85]|uniref:hypothetical protein n=1 Tax=Actinokineospora sp. G85 TaxID=3406626 RepID=UPI003C75954C